MAKRDSDWQPFDEGFKAQAREYGASLLSLAGVSGPISVQRVDSLSLRLPERRLDAVFEVRVEGGDRIIALECEHTLPIPVT